jgi:hypothetical protein
MRKQSTLVSAVTGMYQLLLVLYPASFRREFGREMVLVFRDASRFEQERRGTGGLLGLWMGMFFDLLATALLERVKEASAMSGSSFVRIAGLGGILAGIGWIILVILDPIDNGGFLGYLMSVLPVLILILSLALYLQGGHNAVSTLGLTALAIGSVLLVLSVIFYTINLDPDDGWAFTMLFFGTVIQGLGLIAIGYRSRSLGEFPGWSVTLIPLGIILIVYLPVVAFLDNNVFSSGTNGDLLFQAWLWLQAISWMMLGAIAFIGRGEAADQPTQPAS